MEDFSSWRSRQAIYWEASFPDALQEDYPFDVVGGTVLFLCFFCVPILNQVSYERTPGRNIYLELEALIHIYTYITYVAINVNYRVAGVYYALPLVVSVLVFFVVFGCPQIFHIGCSPLRK